jgi:hypothetical protein
MGEEGRQAQGIDDDSPELEDEELENYGEDNSLVIEDVEEEKEVRARRPNMHFLMENRALLRPQNAADEEKIERKQMQSEPKSEKPSFVNPLDILAEAAESVSSSPTASLVWPAAPPLPAPAEGAGTHQAGAGVPVVRMVVGVVPHQVEEMVPDARCQAPRRLVILQQHHQGLARPPST